MHGLRKVFIASDDCVFATKIVNDLLKRRSNVEVHTTCSTENERAGFRAGAWHTVKLHDCSSIYDILFSIEALARRSVTR